MGNSIIEVIAEIGVNHNGSVELAKSLITSAKSSGADTVKFQTFLAQELVTKDAPLAVYQKENLRDATSQFDLLEKLEFGTTELLELQDYTHSNKLSFLSTPFELQSLDVLLDLGLERIKLSSGNLTDVPLLRAVGQSDVKVVLSTGMSTLEEVDAALEILLSSGVTENAIMLMHCTSAYPAPPEELNLSVIGFMRERYGVDIGYSDHSESIQLPALAVMAGAIAIEKHITLDRNLPGPDHKASLETNEFREMVSLIRYAERVIGKPVKEVTPSEHAVRSVARKSIVAKENIIVGEVFSLNNICLKRPGSGISGLQWDQIVGRVSTKNYQINEFIDE